MDVGTDFTTAKAGEKVAWKVSEAVECPHCGEVGVKFDDDTVVHRVDQDMDGVDVCLNDADHDDPAVLVFDTDGNEIHRAARISGGN